jgi:hypothetical protein
VDGTRRAAAPALLRAGEGHHPHRAATSTPPRLMRRRTAIVLLAVLTPLALLLGAGAAELGNRESRARAPRLAPTAALTPTQDPGICGTDFVNLFAVVARLRGDVASEVVANLPPEYANALHSAAMTTERDALPPPPDAPTLAHVLARLAGPDRRAVIGALPAEQQAAVNGALLDTALTFMTDGVRPPCP